MNDGDELTLRDRERRLGYLLILPPILIVLSIIILPVLWNFWLSVNPITLAELGSGKLYELHFTLENFSTVIGSDRFFDDLVISFVYSFLGVGSSILFGLAAALLLNQQFPGRQFLRGLYLFPYVAPVVAVAYVSWSWILDPASGILSWSLQTIGIINEPIGFLTHEPYALVSLIFFQCWRYGPFCMLFILAKLQSIPSMLYEAAKVDGATPFQRFFLVTLPQLKGILATLFLLRFIWTFNKFQDVYLLTKGSGGTEILPVLLYNLFIGEKDIGAGAALSVILFVVLGGLMVLYFTCVIEEQNSHVQT